MGNFEFRPGILPSLATVLLLGLLLSLGFWQLDRAAQKRALLEAYTARPDDVPVEIDATFRPAPDWRYRRAQVTGNYMPERQFLLDNRVHQGRVGYFVLTPLRLAHSDAAVLVNRGWVAQGASRADLPPLPASTGEQVIQGLIDFPPSKVFVLGEGEDRDPGWPKVLQQLRLDLQSTQLGLRLLPMILLLDSDQADGFVREWTPVVVGPERHVGYAVQWFSLAAVLTVLYLWLNLQRRRPAGDPE
ncbi:MAG: SURF1 family protein [Thiohalobacteraceae bacterium]